MSARRVSAHDLPDGDAFYRAQIREYTTTDMTPEDIHQLGLKEVARIQANMETTMKESGFKGSFPEFLPSCAPTRSSSPATPTTCSASRPMPPSASTGSYPAISMCCRGGASPSSRCRTRLAPFYTAGRGGLESCQMNTYNLPTRPLYNIPVLTLHECVPGHSFQAALAEEGKSLPRFRRNIYFSGYGEGWGLYSEYLGMRWAFTGRPMSASASRATRCGGRPAWLSTPASTATAGRGNRRSITSPATPPLSTHEVETEVDRYISWPGQALAYKLGEMTIRRHARRSRKELGTKFDIKKFHSMILGLGSVPLPELENAGAAWIAQRRRHPFRRPEDPKQGRYPCRLN